MDESFAQWHLKNVRESISNAGAPLSQAALSYLEHGKSFNE
jgi:hypothetical protein